MERFRELISVRQPYQYVGGEENVSGKDISKATLSVCLAFPDAYEIGMANVGMQILYHVVNEVDGFVADRVYAPLDDMEKALRASTSPLVSRERQLPLTDFDWIGFSLQYELSYTNVLLILDLAGIPLASRERSESHPLVGAGGPCALNPEPMADFVDFFVIGEGEDVVLDVCRSLAESKAAGVDRAERLRRLMSIPGVYVPRFYEARYVEGRFAAIEASVGAPAVVTRRVIADLDKVSYPRKLVVPALRPVHDRLAIEIQRGCTRGCRFCQAGWVYRPRRERSPRRLLDIVEGSIEATGNRDVSLMSLSSADYASLHPLMEKLVKRWKGRHLSLSLPSTRPEMLKPEFLEVLKEERHSGVTIAPEAGSQRLRNVINKGFTEESILKTIETLFEHGWQGVKLYFMIGLPTETDEDVLAIGELANKAFRVIGSRPGRKSITVSVSNFIPKPHTPFQWHAQLSLDEVRRRQALVRSAIHYPKQITYKSHESRSSRVEGVLARGSRAVGDVIRMVYERGARFDCWTDRFRYDLWDAALAECRDSSGIDVEAEAFREKDPMAVLPWSHISSGVDVDHFREELRRGLAGELTDDCSFAACSACGLCDMSAIAPTVRPDAMTDIPDTLPPRESTEGPERHWRFRYAREGAGVFISTLETQGMIFRAFRRADIAVGYDNGFRPRPKLVMGQALPLGVSSEAEYFDIWLRTSLSVPDVVARVNQYLPREMAVVDAMLVGATTPPIRKMSDEHVYHARVADVAELGVSRVRIDQLLTEFNGATTLIVEREHKSRDQSTKRSRIDLKHEVSSLSVVDVEGDQVLRFAIRVGDNQSVSPYAVMEWVIGDVTLARQLPLRKVVK